uniref:Protocadherin-8 n=1 Tax=Cynoglossus semilaevis TaxID=244447 RepID=A0A3P8WVN9_CYNSE
MGDPEWSVLLAVLCVSLASLPAVIQGKTIKYETFEEDAVGTVIGNLATDISSFSSSSSSSSGVGRNNNFRMMKQFNSSFIRLRESDGQLSIGEKMDRERICKHASHCLIAFDVVSFSKEQFKLVHVEVEVKDINDNSPAFPRRESSLEISENTAVGTRMPLDFAVDEDVGVNYIQSYQISVNSHFTIDVLSRADGVKYAELVLMKELDRETQPSYALELLAMDGGSPSRTGTTRINVKVRDFNDNSPAFDRSSVSVDLPEDAAVGTLLVDLNAEDPDEGLNGEVVYGFGNQVPSEIRQLFRVDRRTGRLTLESPVDFEGKNTYEFDVEAKDLGANPSPAICKIVVQVRDVNDNAPEISITPMTSITAGIAYITEAAARESFVGLVSTSDRDSGANGQVRCTLYGHDHFKLQQAYEDSFMIVSTSSLDREKIPEYNLTVVAEDLGSPPFRTIKQYTIRLIDENDNAPVFSKPVYEVAVVENNALGAYVTTVVARDSDAGSNGKVSYELADTYFMGSPISSFVSLDPASGSLYALRSFNYEVMKQLELRVTASDGGSPPLSGSANVYIRILDVNDNAPSVVQPVLNNGSAEILLSRDATAGTVVTRVEARDVDEGVNSDLSYALTSTSDPGVFAINKVTGEIHLNQALGQTVDETLTVTVTVSDNGRPSLSSSAILYFVVIEGPPPSVRTVYQSGTGEDVDVEAQWDLSVVIIVVLAGSCTLLLLAIILIATTCNRHKQSTKDAEDGDSYEGRRTTHLGRSHAVDNPLLSLQGASEAGGVGVDGFDGHSSYSGHAGEFCSAHPGGSDMCSASEDGSEVPCVYDSDSNSNVRGNKHEEYSTLPGYGNVKEAVRPITIWKGNSYTTISARDPVFSGKDSGKGDSDFNDSDSDVSGETGLKRDMGTVPEASGQNALWACTSECKILGHSDRCWSPSAVRANAAPSPAPALTLSSFGTLPKTASLPRDPSRRENYYQAHIPKTVGLQSVYEKVLHREYDYVMVTPPRPARMEEIGEVAIPVYTPSPSRRSNTEA